MLLSAQIELRIYELPSAENFHKIQIDEIQSRTIHGTSLRDSVCSGWKCRRFARSRNFLMEIEAKTVIIKLHERRHPNPERD
jgi:hypothetical protein